MSADRQILITGVSGAIGSKVAEYFLAKECRVFGMDITDRAPEACAKNDHFTYAQCDLSDGEAAAGVIDAHIKDDGPVTHVINNVGLIFNSPLVKFEDGQITCHGFEEWNRVLSVSLSSAFYVSAACVKHLVPDGIKGTIINISSICAQGNPGQAAYSAAKAGLNGLTMALAKELGPLGIRVVSIAPGFLDTPSTLQAVREDRLMRIRRSTPLKRLGTVDDLNHAIQFVFDNEFYTGAVLNLDGGLRI
ncbi:MAG: SDR family NAD(P)-dependent oxidoreductase [Elusimicrobiota bacterium]